MKRKFQIGLVVILFALVTILMLIFNLTSPSTLSLPMILAVFILVYFIFFTFGLLCANIVTALIKYFHKKNDHPKPAAKYKRWHKRSVYIVAFLALMPLFFVSLNSLGKVGVLEVGLIVLFEALAIFYIVKKT